MRTCYAARVRLLETSSQRGWGHPAASHHAAAPASARTSTYERTHEIDVFTTQICLDANTRHSLARASPGGNFTVAPRDASRVSHGPAMRSICIAMHRQRNRYGTENKSRLLSICWLVSSAHCDRFDRPGASRSTATQEGAPVTASLVKMKPTGQAGKHLSAVHWHQAK
jgi:hypothetical protein